MRNAGERGRKRLADLAAGLAALLLGTLPARAAVNLVPPEGLQFDGSRLRNDASGVLSVIGYSLVPGSAATSLSITRSDTGNPSLSMGQLGSGFTWSDDFPLYMEGFLGYARYDPKYVFSAGATTSRLPSHWNSLGGVGGIGWDFQIGRHWYLRPIANVILGYVASDARLFGLLLQRKTDYNLDFLSHGQLLAGGGGGSLALAYYLRREAYEVDLELRSTNLFLTALPSSSRAVQGDTWSLSTSIWARLRVPAGFTLFRRPVRYVGEFMNSGFYGPELRGIGIGTLYSIGGGLEADVGGLEIGAFGLNMERLRVVGRYFFGPHVSGTSVGIGLSF